MGYYDHKTTTEIGIPRSHATSITGSARQAICGCLLSGPRSAPGSSLRTCLYRLRLPGIIVSHPRPFLLDLALELIPFALNFDPDLSVLPLSCARSRDCP